MTDFQKGFTLVRMTNIPDEDFIELVESYRALLADYEHIAFVDPVLYTRSVEALANADKLLPTLRAGANIEDWQKHLGVED